MAGWRRPVRDRVHPGRGGDVPRQLPGPRRRERDIRKREPRAPGRASGMEPGELDLFEGSPPCASFSSAGAERRLGEEKKYSDSEQRTDDLFWEWARVLDGPPAARLHRGERPGDDQREARSEEYAHKITRKLSGPRVPRQREVLNAANYGVPQERRAADLRRHPERRRRGAATWDRPYHPTPTTPTPHTLRQALETVTHDDPGVRRGLPQWRGTPSGGRGRAWRGRPRRGPSRGRTSQRLALPALRGGAVPRAAPRRTSGTSSRRDY
jgi:hypothetical protein